MASDRESSPPGLEELEINNKKKKRAGLPIEQAEVEPRCGFVEA